MKNNNNTQICARTVNNFLCLQMNCQCSCFQSIDLLKSRPAHLAAFIHHVVSQFDPAPLVRSITPLTHKPEISRHLTEMFINVPWTSLACLWFRLGSDESIKLSLLALQLCYLYADLYKQTSTKETQRILMNTFFKDKTAVRKLHWGYLECHRRCGLWLRAVFLFLYRTWK